MRERLVLEAQGVLDFCREHGFTLATAESCTGGLVVGLSHAIAGASDIVERGFVTYSNDAKAEMLGVDARSSPRTARCRRQAALAMAAGALWRSKASVSVAVTGIAGPGGGSEDKPVGLVHFAVARRAVRSRRWIQRHPHFEALHHRPHVRRNWPRSRSSCAGCRLWRTALTRRANASLAGQRGVAVQVRASDPRSVMRVALGRSAERAALPVAINSHRRAPRKQSANLRNARSNAAPISDCQHARAEFIGRC